MSKKFNLEEMRKKSLEARQNQDKDFEGAYEEAFQTVIKDANDKIEKAMNDGKFRAYLYIWHYVSDKNDRRFTFKNVRMFDIVTKGPLISRLQEHFGSNDSSDEDNRLFVGWHKFPNSAQRSRYGIYVSWAEKKEGDDQEPTTDDSTNVSDSSTKVSDVKTSDNSPDESEAKSSDEKSTKVKTTSIKKTTVASTKGKK